MSHGKKRTIRTVAERRDARRLFRLPKFWSDEAVRRAVIATWRQMTIDQAREAILTDFGAARTPSRSAIGRAWVLLDCYPRMVEPARKDV